MREQSSRDVKYSRELVAELDAIGIRAAYHWLSEQQFRAALAYAAAYPKEIEERLQAEERWTPATLWTTYPFMKPRRTE